MDRRQVHVQTGAGTRPERRTNHLCPARHRNLLHPRADDRRDRLPHAGLLPGPVGQVQPLPLGRGRTLHSRPGSRHLRRRRGEVPRPGDPRHGHIGEPLPEGEPGLPRPGDDRPGRVAGQGEYPSNLGSGSINNQIKKKGAFLKKKFIEKTGNKNIANIVCKYINTPSISQVASIICTIIKLARQDKIDYLNYLKDFEQDPEHIKKFIIAMYIGYHTREQLNHILNLKYNNIFKILNTYYVYYTNERKGKILVSKDDLGKEIQEIIKSDVKIAFADDQTNCIIQSNDKKILRVVYHWKNKFQGIQTPCLNIFKEI